MGWLIFFSFFFFASILYDSRSSDTYLGSPAKLICTGLILWWTMYGYIYNTIVQKKMLLTKVQN